jgi:hypothetical protein
MGLEYDGMPKKKIDEMQPEQLDQDKLIGYIMRKTKEDRLSYEEVQAVLDAETEFLVEHGYIDAN